MELYTHQCIKKSCEKRYQDNDPDPYYCSSCLKNKKKVAARAEKILATMPKLPRTSELARYDAAPKVNGRFPRASDFM